MSMLFGHAGPHPCNAKILRLYISFVIYFQITFKIDNFAY